MEGLRDGFTVCLPDVDPSEYSPILASLVIWLGAIDSRTPETDQKIGDVEHREMHDIRASRIG